MNRNIIFLDTTENYPFRFSANNSKNELIARGLVECGNSVKIINSPAGLEGNFNETVTGSKNGIEYLIFPRWKTGRIISFIKNIGLLIEELKKSKTNTNSSCLILCYKPFPIFLLYFMLGRLLSYKIIITITEWHLYFENISTIKRMDYFIFDYLFGWFSDAILPISQVIEDNSRRFNKPVMKIPILADYESIKPKNIDINIKPYFLYCGHSGYFQPIELIIKAFTIFGQSNAEVQLVLVLHGPDKSMARVLELVNISKCASRILVKRHLPFAELIERYQGAEALLIPLRSDKQDKARFPHKIGEYTATGRPIITGNVGEVKRYFTHGNDSFIAADFSPEAYADQMRLVISNSPEADAIGLQGRKLGEKFFDFKLYGKKIADFLNRL